MRIHSLLPPVSFQSPNSGQWYIATTDPKLGWVEVDRQYNWLELKKMWVRYQFNPTIKNVVLLPKSKQNQTFSVEGSKGNRYTIVNDGSIWNCSCPAHGFGRGKDCKHIQKLKSKVYEV